MSTLPVGHDKDREFEKWLECYSGRLLKVKDPREAGALFTPWSAPGTSWLPSSTPSALIKNAASSRLVRPKTTRRMPSRPSEKRCQNWAAPPSTPAELRQIEETLFDDDSA
ncbi:MULTISPECIES: hypothetical protein [unclassified Streptomyces]|uniref:hypothetical protein n=1 Tax=unclassified Streptomyces TaxID=2593676 RepID=UPI002E80452F|nr:hypothetical protein [Streptomyces sp. NBC_00562]WUC23173.1 hypothetical protein OHA33_32335 [Streptomyces sp. NBC_00562]